MVLGIDSAKSAAGQVKRNSIPGYHQILQKKNVIDAKVQEETLIPILLAKEPETRPLLQSNVILFLGTFTSQ
jgi:hypothetical protein